MLISPEDDPPRRAADEALMRAVRARADLGPAPSPDAEALAYRAAVDAAPDTVTLDLLRGVWGRLDASQRPSLAVHGPEAALFAADRFGLNLRLTETAEAALASVQGRSRALIELDARPWWGRLLARPELRVAAAFPEARQARPRALLVSAETTGPTGDDRTFWVTDSRLSEARIVDDLSRVGLPAEPLLAAGGLKLFVLAGYVQAEDGRLDGAPGDLSGVIGAAPQY